MEKSYRISALEKGGYVVAKDNAFVDRGAYNPAIFATANLDEALAFIKTQMESKAIELP